MEGGAPGVEVEVQVAQGGAAAAPIVLHQSQLLNVGRPRLACEVAHRSRLSTAIRAPQVHFGSAITFSRSMHVEHRHLPTLRACSESCLRTTQARLRAHQYQYMDVNL